MECDIEIGGFKKSDKNDKIIKRIQLQGEIEEIRINYLLERRMRSDLIKTFKIINGFLIMVDLFFIFLLELEIYCQG